MAKSPENLDLISTAQFVKLYPNLYDYRVLGNDYWIGRLSSNLW